MRCRPYRIPALVLLATAACLAAALPAAGQGDGFEPPRLLNEREIAQQVLAGYPAAQRDSAVRGYVVLSFRVRADSTADPASVAVREASDDAFVAPATALVPVMRFAPTRLGGRAVEAWITHHVLFDLQDARATVERAAAPDEGTYELSAVEELPEFLDRRRIARLTEARFPRALRDSAISGAVVLRFMITESGTVDPASPRVEVTTDRRFDEAAVSVILQARFRPAKVNGRPVKVWVTVPLHFQVEAPEPAESAGTAPPA